MLHMRGQLPGENSQHKLGKANAMFDTVAAEEQARFLSQTATAQGALEMTLRHQSHKPTIVLSLLFEPATFIDDGSKRSRGMRIKCGRCPISETIKANTMSGGPTADLKEERMLAGKFSKRGWRVGSTTDRHRCPSCIETERAESQVNTVLRLPTATVPQIPPEIPLDHRRLIILKLSETYGDAGYKEQWTDKRVALDLGVPIEHVAYLREQNFGTCASNPSIEDALEKAREIERRLLDRAKELMDAAQVMRDEAAGLAEEAGQIRASLAEIKGAVK